VIKIGQIVPSSNATMAREIPASFRARETILPDRGAVVPVVTSAGALIAGLQRLAVEARVGVPVGPAATCTAWQLMKKLGLEPRVPQAGALPASGFA